MKKRILGLSLVSLIQWNLNTGYACDEQGKTGFLPENKLSVPVNAKSVSTVTEQKFNEIITDIAELYEPIIKKKGGTLQVNRLWSDATVNASAQRSGSTYVVNMYGGLARHSTITADGFALVMCHELGHHLGGAPKKAAMFGAMWASNEGQADYWGNMKCMRHLFENEDNARVLASMKVDTYVEKSCLSQFTQVNDRNICIRTAMAGLSLGNLFKVLRNLRTDLTFQNPDPSRVARTNDNHPEPQCRLDTYFNGALCEADLNDEVSDKDENQGVCTTKNGQTVGVRPLCWFKPKA